MLMQISIPTYDGEWIDQFWNDTAQITITVACDGVKIEGTAESLYLLAKQMLYFGCNDFLLVDGAHVHYDVLSDEGIPTELVVCLEKDNDALFSVDVDQEVLVHLYIPERIEDLYSIWTESSRISALIEGSSIQISGNRNALYSLSSMLLYLCNCGDNCPFVICSSDYVKEWNGRRVTFVCKNSDNEPI